MITKTASGDLDTYMFEGDLTGDGQSDFAVEVRAYSTLGYIVLSKPEAFAALKIGEGFVSESGLPCRSLAVVVYRVCRVHGGGAV